MNTEVGKTSQHRANLVKSLREQRSWTQSHLAQVTGLSDRTIQRIESDGTASKESLLALASAFEIDVTTLSEEPTKKAEKLPPVKLLVICEKGNELLDLSAGTHLFQPSFAEPNSSETAELIASFFDYIRDCGDILSEVSFQDRVKFGLELTDLMKQLNELGYLVFVHRRKVKMRSNNDPNFFMDAEILTVVVTEKENPKIIKRDGTMILPVVIENGPIA